MPLWNCLSASVYQSDIPLNGINWIRHHILLYFRNKKVEEEVPSCLFVSLLVTFYSMMVVFFQPGQCAVRLFVLQYCWESLSW